MKKKNFKILLISFYNDEAYGVRQLHAVLHAQGYDAKMVFVKARVQDSLSGSINSLTNIEEDLLVEFIKKQRPYLIGVSLVSSNFTLYKRIYQRIRPMGDFKIILGGWQVSLNPQDCISYADILCIGEGEDALLEVVENLSESKPIDGLKNLWVNRGDTIIRNPVRPLTTNLDRFPYPVFNNQVSYYLENNKLENIEPYSRNNRYGTMIAQGCPFSCTYCSNNFMARNVYPGEWSKRRFRSVSHVIEELSVVKEKFPNVERINFYDEIFLPRKEWAWEFSQRYSKEIGLPFYCMFYPGTCSEEMAKILKSANLCGVWLGVQSGSERVRREVFKRNYSNAEILEHVRIFARYGISVKYDFILENPFESFRESLETIYLLLELPEPFSLNLFSLKFFPNTEITERALREGIIQQSELNDALRTDHQNYIIKRDDDNIDNDFINKLALYINCLASRSMLHEGKDRINKLIAGYLQKKDIRPVSELLNSVYKLYHIHEDKRGLNAR